MRRIHLKAMSLIAFGILFCTFGCASVKFRDLSFLPDHLKKQNKEPKLNVFMPKDASAKNFPVLIFIHGGNWNRGDKDIYVLMGRNFAKKGVVAVIPDYTLSPDANYDRMAREVAAAIEWTKQNITKYKGDPDRVFLSGHSAGGHLAALAVMNPKYGIRESTIRGLVLNDAAGLDIKQHLEQFPPGKKYSYSNTWTNDPENWKDASPIYFLNSKTPPIYMYTGRKTFDMIELGNDRFLQELHKVQPGAVRQFNNKNHFSMIIQYFFSGSNRFEEMLDFMKKIVGSRPYR